MADPTGESKSEALRLDFDRRLILRFYGSAITSDGGLLAYRELDDVLALTTSGGETLAEARTGRNRAPAATNQTTTWRLGFQREPGSPRLTPCGDGERH